MFQSVYVPFVSAVLLGCSMLNFFFLWIIFSHYRRDVLSANLLQSACHLKVTLRTSRFSRVLALRRICLHRRKDISVLAGTLHLLEGKYYPLFSWKIPYLSSISLKCCDISYHCTTRMFLLGNAQTILMSMFIHQRKSFFSPRKIAKLFLS